MGQYHVVCHNCTFEELVDDETQAENLTSLHEMHDHDVEYGRVA